MSDLSDFAHYCCGKPDCPNNCEREPMPSHVDKEIRRQQWTRDQSIALMHEGDVTQLEATKEELRCTEARVDDLWRERDRCKDELDKIHCLAVAALDDLSLLELRRGSGRFLAYQEAVGVAQMRLRKIAHYAELHKADE